MAMLASAAIRARLPAFAQGAAGMAFVVAVAQQKGGAGKSTVAANLAAALAAEGHRVALLDTHPQDSLAPWHGGRMKRGEKARPLAFEASAGWRVPATLDRLRGAHDI